MDGSAEESDEWGEHTKIPVVQSTPKATPVKSPESGAQVQEQVQQAFLQVTEAQVKHQVERTGIRKYYKYGDSDTSRTSAQKRK